MLQSKESLAVDSTSFWKLLVCCGDKHIDLPRRLGKGIAGLFIITSIASICYTILVGRFPWKLPDCIKVTEVGANISVLDQHFDARPSETNISHIVFGIGGSAASWNKRRNYTELWWRGDEMRGYIWLDQPPNYRWRVEDPPYRVSEDATRFPFRSRSGPRSAVRLSRIFLETVRLRLGGVRWYVIGDDDTVFFPDNLVAVLSKYDHESMYYIGGLSESVEQNLLHSYNMAFGGGGIALSYVLAEELAKIFDGCLLRYNSLYGSDQRIAACVSELGVPFTREPGFHQMDIRGDAYGLLAAHPVAPLVSLHHLERLKPLLPFKTQIEALASIALASRVDPLRIMQQTFGYDDKKNWSVSVTWGYTVQIFSAILPPMVLERAFQTFLTWRSQTPGPFTFNTQPWIMKKCGGPLIYYLDDAVLLRGKWTLSTYRRHDALNIEDCNVSGHLEELNVTVVQVLAPQMNMNEWKQGPRRYCSVIDPTIGSGRMMVRLKKCHTGDSAYSQQAKCGVDTMAKKR